MTQFIRVEAHEGEIIRIEIEPISPPSGVVPATRPDEVMIRAREVFDEVFGAIGLTAATVVAQIRQLSELPDRVEVKFGIKIDAEVGAMVAKAGAEGQYLITLTWERSSMEDGR